MLRDDFANVQPIPNRSQYGVNDVALFHRHSRKALEAEGEVVPPFNPALRPKYWRDAAAALKDPEDEMTYTVIRTRNMVSTVTVVHMSAREAASLNIPGDNQSATREEWEFPIRELQPFEKPTFALNAVVIERTDLKAVEEANKEGFHPSDRAKLNEILDLLRTRQ